LIDLADVMPRRRLDRAFDEADFVWRDRRLIVEVDGWVAHGTRRAF
jgi:very-short-patch-repair endonuclease